MDWRDDESFAVGNDSMAQMRDQCLLTKGECLGKVLEITPEDISQQLL